MSIRFKLLTGISILAFSILFFAGFSFYDSLKQVQTYSFSKKSSETINHLLNAAGNWAVERGVTNAALNSTGVVNDRILKIINLRRKRGDEAYRLALAEVQSYSFNGKNDLIRKVKKDYKDAVLLRVQADINIKLPRNERDGALLKTWVPTMSKLIIESQQLRFALTKKTATTDSELGRQSNLKHFSWIMSEFAGRERAVIGGALSSGKPLSKQKLQILSTFRGKVETGWDLIKQLSVESNNEVQQKLSNIQKVFLGSFQTIREKIYQAGSSGEPYPLNAEEWIKEATIAIDTILAFQKASTNETVQYVDGLVRGAWNSLVFYGVSLLVSIGLVLGMFYIIMYRVIRPINGMRQTMDLMAEGISSEIPSLAAKDEIGQIARSLLRINDIGQSALKVQIALDRASCPMMMVGLDLKINYTNEALVDMFSMVERNIGEQVYGFQAKALEGTDIESLLAGTSYLTGTLSTLNSTYKETYIIAGHIFDVAATPVINKEGEKLGTVIEWQDVTLIRRREKQQNAVLAEVQTVVQANAEGDFSKRVSIEGLDGFLLQLANGMNDINSLIDNALNEINSSLASIAEGDLSRNINGQYMGMLGEIKSSFNNTLKKLQIIISDATEVSVASSQGDFGKRIKLDGKEGFMLELAQGINNINEVSNKGLNDIRASLQAISRGDLTQGITDHYEGMFDEIKQACNHTLKQLVSIISDATDAAEAAGRGDFSRRINVSGKDGFMLELAEGINSINEVSLRGLNEVQKIATLLANGDLKERFSGDFQGMFEEIQEALNNTIDKLSLTAGQIQESVHSVDSAASEISSGSNDLSHRTESQSAGLQKTAAAIEEMVGTIQQNTDNSSEADKLARNSLDVAENGMSIVTDAVSAMGRIEESSTQITDITNVIDEIAFQINLLALNAAVEAARAGEAGKGFEVVAAEVRKLAQRSANAAKDIATLLEKSDQEVRSGSQLVNKTGGALEEIVGSIRSLANIVGDIATASQEQSVGIDQINQTMVQLDSMTQQNAALVEESNAAAQTMADQSKHLNRLIGFFKTNGAVNGGHTKIGVKLAS